MQRADDVLTELQGSQARLQFRIQPKAAADATRKAEGFEAPETPAGQRGPGAIHTDTVVHASAIIGCLQEAAVKRREAIRLSLSPNAPLCVRPRKVSQQLLGDFLGSCTKAVGYIAPRGLATAPG
jgi:hypothetical protein